MSTVYSINKGVGKPIVFKGLKAQYITYLAIGLVLLLLLFAAMYVSGLPLVVCLPLTLSLGAGLFLLVIYASKHFGEHGLKKWIARTRLPDAIHVKSRQVFIRLKHTPSNDIH